jgi:hypothetical protein
VVAIGARVMIVAETKDGLVDAAHLWVATVIRAWVVVVAI